MATFIPRKITETGVSESLTDCNTGGDNFYNSGTEFIKIVNDHASNHYKITFTPDTTSVKTTMHGTMTKSATVIQVDNGEEAIVGPFKPNIWNDTNNKVGVTYGHGTGSGSSEDTAIGTGSHALKAEVLFLDPK